MRRTPLLALLSSLLLAAACSECELEGGPAPLPPGTPEEARSANAPVEEDPDCNLATPLVPGVPGSPGHLIVSPRNPNGDSELSHLMRVFVDDLQEARANLRSGAAVEKLRDKHKKLRCAWPTLPEQRNETYDALARAYLADLRAFDEAPTRETYNAIVQSCIACHSVSCGGPIDFIEALRWD